MDTAAARRARQAWTVLGDCDPDLPDDQGTLPVALPRHGRIGEFADAPVSTRLSGAGSHPDVATGGAAFGEDSPAATPGSDTCRGRLDGPEDLRRRRMGESGVSGSTASRRCNRSAVPSRAWNGAAARGEQAAHLAQDPSGGRRNHQGHHRNRNYRRRLGRQRSPARPARPGRVGGFASLGRWRLRQPRLPCSDRRTGRSGHHPAPRRCGRVGRWPPARRHSPGNRSQGTRRLEERQWLPPAQPCREHDVPAQATR